MVRFPSVIPAEPKPFERHAWLLLLIVTLLRRLYGHQETHATDGHGTTMMQRAASAPGNDRRSEVICETIAAEASLA